MSDIKDSTSISGASSTICSVYGPLVARTNRTEFVTHAER